jgi:hypothetical protein
MLRRTGDAVVELDLVRADAAPLCEVAARAVPFDSAFDPGLSGTFLLFPFAATQYALSNRQARTRNRFDSYILTFFIAGGAFYRLVR